MISTSFITGTGFMKCIPMTLSGFEVTCPSTVIEIDDVFEASTASGGVFSSKNRNRSNFRSSRSVAASIASCTSKSCT